MRTALGPAGAWWLRERFAGRVPLHTGVRIASAEPGRGVRLTLVGADGATATMRADHVIAATGYAVDVTRIGVLEESLRRAIRTDGAMPRLSRTFETSVPGLYLTGLAAAGTFGPAMRFVYGAAFAARRLTQGCAAGAPADPAHTYSQGEQPP
ncbi:NAD(P)/FAD-dependent oxidoreductase [Thermocatellispora tengchongensis]|uniref:hypothetical protein n=1 Tax=Thermocatellispora tengchongensis TaxID=1073253 RepID=UPI00363F32F7